MPVHALSTYTLCADASSLRKFCGGLEPLACLVETQHCVPPTYAVQQGGLSSDGRVCCAGGDFQLDAAVVRYLLAEALSCLLL